MKGCLFCDIQKDKKELIYENAYYYVTFDVHPVSPGHTLIISKRHVVSLLDLNNDEWINLNSTIKETLKILEKTNFSDVYKKMRDDKITPNSPYFCNEMLKHIGINKKPEAYNIGVNDGLAAGRTINHLHVQIIPRYNGDVDNPSGGLRHIIPGLGDYKKFPNKKA